MVTIRMLFVPADFLEEMDKHCREHDSELPRDHRIFDEEVVFDDGVRMAIQVITPLEPANEACWAQGVLYDENGNEMGCTEVRDSLSGGFRVGNYAVGVMASFFTEEPSPREPIHATIVIIPVYLLADMLDFLDPDETATVTYLSGDRYKIVFGSPQCFDDFSMDTLNRIEFPGGDPTA